MSNITQIYEGTSQIQRMVMAFATPEVACSVSVRVRRLGETASAHDYVYM